MINLGDIYFGITPDVSRLNAAVMAVKRFGDTVERSARSQAKGAQENTAALMRQERALVGATRQARALLDQMLKTGASGEIMDQLSKRLNGLTNAFAKGKLSPLEYQRGLTRWQLALDDSKRSLQGVQGRMREWEDTLKAQQKTVKETERAWASHNRTMNQVGNISSSAERAYKQQEAQQRAATTATKRIYADETAALNAAQREKERLLAATQREEEQGLRAMAAIREREAAARIALENRLQRALDTAQHTQRGFQQRVTRSGAPVAIADQGTSALQTLQTTLRSPTIDSQGAVRAIQQYRAAMQGATFALQDFGNSHSTSGRKVGIFNDFLKNTARSAELVTGPLGGVAVRINVLNSLLGSSYASWGLLIAGAVGAAAAILKGSEAIIKFEMAFETAQRGLTAMSGSTVDTSIRMRQLMEIADQTGTSFTTLLKPFTGWLESTRNTGLEGQKSIEIFRNMAQVAGQLGEPFETVNSVFLNLRRMMSSNSVTARELRTRLETELPGAADAAAKALGTTRDQLDHLQKEGINVQEFIYKFSQAWADRFGGMNKPVEGLTAATNRWHNAIDRLWDSLDKGFHISERYIATLETLVGWIDKFTKGSRDLNDTTDSINQGMSKWGALPAILDKINIGGMTFHDLADKMRKSNDDFARTTNTSVIAAQNFGSALSGANAPMKEFVDQQGKLQYQTDKATTDQYLTKVNDQVAELTARLTVEKEALAELKRTASSPTAIGPFGTLTGANSSDATTERMIFQVRRTEAALQNLSDTQRKLKEIAAKPTGPAEFDPESTTEAMLKAMRNADKEIEKLKGELSGLGHGDSFFKRVKEDAQDTEAIETFSNKLYDAGVKGDRAATKVEQFAKATRDVRQATRDMVDLKTPWQVLEDVFKGLDNSISTFTSAIFDGTLGMKTFANIGKKVLQDLMNEIIKLGIMGPLLRSLFGTQTQTLGASIGGGPGIGGAIGNFASSLFGGSGTQAPVANMSYGPQLPIAAMGMAVTPGGFRYGLGGSNIFTSPTMFGSARGPILGAEAGPEALMPLTRTSGGKLGVRASLAGFAGNDNEHPTSPAVAVHFHGAPPGTRVEESQDQGGGRRLDAYFDDMMAKNIGTTGSAAQKSFASTMGIRPRTIRRGAA